MEKTQPRIYYLTPKVSGSLTRPPEDPSPESLDDLITKMITPSKPIDPDGVGERIIRYMETCGFTVDNLNTHEREHIIRKINSYVVCAIRNDRDKHP